MDFLFSNNNKVNKKEILIEKQAILNDLQSTNLTPIEKEALHMNYLFYEQLINKIDSNRGLLSVFGISFLLSINILNILKLKRTLFLLISGVNIYEGLSFFSNLNERTLIYSQNKRQNIEFEEITNIKI
jgi:hypothetical protein